jgi:hypothetical protein
MKIELKQHIGIGFDGAEVTVPQWRIFADGFLIGYLPHAVNSEILPLATYPWHMNEEIIAACVEHRKLLDNRESIVKPPQEHLKEVLGVIQELQKENLNDS